MTSDKEKSLLPQRGQIEQQRMQFSSWENLVLHRYNLELEGIYLLVLTMLTAEQTLVFSSSL